MLDMGSNAAASTWVPEQGAAGRSAVSGEPLARQLLQGSHASDNWRGAGGVQMMIMAMAVDPSGRFVVAGGLGGCLARLWSLASLQVTSTLMPAAQHPTSSITCCGSGGTAAPPSSNVASAAPSSNAPFGSAPSRGGGALSVCWLGNNKVLLGTDTGEIKVWCSSLVVNCERNAMDGGQCHGGQCYYWVWSIQPGDLLSRK